MPQAPQNDVVTEFAKRRNFCRITNLVFGIPAFISVFIIPPAAILCLLLMVIALITRYRCPACNCILRGGKITTCSLCGVTLVETPEPDQE